MDKKPKVLSIVGPTSSGKTSLSIKLASAFEGEVISADSRQVYRGINLLSGKVTQEEMGDIPHHLLDIADPVTVYTADDFVRDASTAITDITERTKLPIIAGGTFFYIDALLGKQTLPRVAPNIGLRQELEQRTTEDLFAELTLSDPARASTIDSKNRRRLIRALEIIATLGTVPQPTEQSIYETFTIGIHIPAETLHKNIKQRLLERLASGMVDEAKKLILAGVSHERMEELGLECRYVSRYLRDELSYDEMVSQLETKTCQFAKRQMTWLKRDDNIHWINPQSVDDYGDMVNKVKTWLKN